MVLIMILFVIGMIIIYGKLSSERDREGKTSVDYHLQYVDGLPNITGGSKVILKTKNNKMVLDKNKSIVITIPRTDLLNAEIMSKNQIIQKVTLGRFMMFGVFALGLKKTQNVFENYLVITYKQDNESKQLVFHPLNNLEHTVKNIREYIGATS